MVSRKLDKRLIVVSNRLPVRIMRRQSGQEVVRSTGGLITAIEPVLKSNHGVWIGWHGSTEPNPLTAEFEKVSRKSGYTMHPVNISAEEVDLFYQGFSNEIIWPLFHDLQTRCNFVPDYWKCYLSVNQRIADKTIEHSNSDDYIWVHDYHLMHVGKFIKESVPSREIGFFLHIPFPNLDIFSKLPWRIDILDALLEYERIGFQTGIDRANFLGCLSFFKPEVEQVYHASEILVVNNGKTSNVGVFPISIDTCEFETLAVKRRIEKSNWYHDKKVRPYKVILGVDRLDYTKGVIEKLQAYRTVLQRYPELIGKVALMQLIVPSREKVTQYRNLKAEIERLVSRINGEFTIPGWVPIYYFYQTLSRENLAAFYRSSAIAMITPLRDGMNLVAKEYCASNIEEDGVLILSEFAGCAHQLRIGALIVNPYDREQTADAIFQAVMMSGHERKERMHKMRNLIREYDIYKWLDLFLDYGQQE